jgi:hypothetical protein
VLAESAVSCAFPPSESSSKLILPPARLLMIALPAVLEFKKYVTHHN